MQKRNKRKAVKKSGLRDARDRRGGMMRAIARIERETDEGDYARLDSAIITRPIGYPRLQPRPLRPMPGAQVTIQQTLPGSSAALATGLTGDLIVAQQAADTAVVLSFSLADLDQAATLIALYEQYRFEKVKVLFVASVNNVQLTSATAPPAVPPLITVVDYDDGSVLASAAAAYQYDIIALSAPYQSLAIELIPKFNTLTQTDGGGNTGGLTTSVIEEWMSTAVSTVLLRGIKCYLPQDSSATGHQSWRVYLEYTVSFKNLK